MELEVGLASCEHTRISAISVLGLGRIAVQVARYFTLEHIGGWSAVLHLQRCKCRSGCVRALGEPVRA